MGRRRGRTWFFFWNVRKYSRMFQNVIQNVTKYSVDDGPSAQTHFLTVKSGAPLCLLHFGIQSLSFTPLPCHLSHSPSHRMKCVEKIGLHMKKKIGDLVTHRTKVNRCRYNNENDEAKRVSIKTDLHLKKTIYSVADSKNC